MNKYLVTTSMGYAGTDECEEIFADDIEEAEAEAHDILMERVESMCESYVDLIEEDCEEE